jgi:N-acetylglucosamine kinase-like BadF-type ATPase
MKFVVGIDGGGTKTRAGLFEIRQQGAPLGEPLAVAEEGPCNIAFMPLDESAANIARVIAALGARPDDVCAVGAAVAGYSFASRREPFLARIQISLPGVQFALFPDFTAAFAGALPRGSGVLVIAGTGSVACGAKSDQGRRAGGYGYLIDDRGSGYGVGRSAIAAVLGALDGTGPATSLTGRISEQIRIATDDWDGYIEAVYSGRVSRVAIASLAEVVAAAARDDADEVSERLLMKAGGALALLAEAVHRPLWTANGSTDAATLPIARVGSLWGAGSSLTKVFERSCRRFAPNCVFVEPESDPVYGAALIAERLYGGASVPKFGIAAP